MPVVIVVAEEDDDEDELPAANSTTEPLELDEPLLELEDELFATNTSPAVSTASAIGVEIPFVSVALGSVVRGAYTVTAAAAPEELLEPLLLELDAAPLST
jgi:hypothetical protein